MRVRRWMIANIPCLLPCLLPCLTFSLVGCQAPVEDDTPDSPTPGEGSPTPAEASPSPAGSETATPEVSSPTVTPTVTPTMTPTVTPTATPEVSTPTPTGPLTLSSTAFEDGGTLPDHYICAEKTGLPDDTNPPLDWVHPPEGTEEFVLLMSTVAKNSSGTTTKYNWVLYDIPLTAYAIPEYNTVITSGHTGTTQVGTAGLTSDGPDYDYSPPCSQGPGLKSYTFTLYAVSEPPVFTPNPTPGAGGDGANLEASLADITLATAALTVSYTFQ